MSQSEVTKLMNVTAFVHPSFPIAADFIARLRAERRRSRNANGGLEVFYGVNTCWWTSHADDLDVTRAPVPTDPAGGVLFQARDIDKFLKCAEENPGHYGEFGLEAFVLAYHGFLRAWDPVNVGEHIPWALAGWDAYTEVLKRHQMGLAPGNPFLSN